MALRESCVQDGGSRRRRLIFGRRPRPGVRGQAVGYRDPFFADPFAVEDDARRLRGPDD